MKPKIGRNDKCWCGSGKKFKRCHLGRQAQSQPGKQEVLERLFRVYQGGCCVHPDAGTTTCSHKIISAHTIQRNGHLSVIARNGHVYNLLRHGSLLDQAKWDPNSRPNKVGIREASTFRGFCSRHDNELFAPIEKEAFKGTEEQISLLGYRAICYELLMKEFALGVDNILRDFDKGQPVPFQQIHQEAFNLRDSGVSKAIDELRSLKSYYDGVIFERGFDGLDYYVATFSKTPEVMCSGTTQVTHDFRGKKFAELGHLDVQANWLTFSLIATDDGGAAIFSWPADHAGSKRVLMSLNDLSDADQPHAIIRFIFEFFENTYFSPDWWDGLEKHVQVQLKERQLRDMVGPWGEQDRPRPDDCLTDDGIKAVDWPEIRRLTSIDSAGNAE